TEVTADALERLRQGGEIEAVAGGTRAQRHRGVALHAEITDARLALPALIHGHEDRIVGGVGVHARGPLLVLAAVALAAGRRIEQLLATRQRAGRLDATARIARDRQRDENQAVADGPREAARHAPETCSSCRVTARACGLESNRLDPELG